MRRRKKFDWRTFWLFVLLSTFIGNRRYKGDRSHLKGAGGFFVDLLCILCLTPLAVMIVNHYEKRDMKRSAKIMARNSSSAQSQRTSSTNPSRQSATAHEKDREKSSTVAAERHCRKTDGAVCRRQPRLFGASRIGLRSGRRPLLGEIKPLHHPGQFVPYGHQ